MFHGLRADTILGRGLGMRAPGPGRNDGLNTPPRQLGAEGVAVIGFVRDQAGQQRVRLLPKHGLVWSGLGRPARAGTGAALSLRQAMTCTRPTVLSSHHTADRSSSART